MGKNYHTERERALEYFSDKNNWEEVKNRGTTKGFNENMLIIAKYYNENKDLYITIYYDENKDAWQATDSETGELTDLTDAESVLDTVDKMMDGQFM